MPQLGDIELRESRELKRKNGIKRNRWIWTACQECGRERWQFLWRWRKGLDKYCQLCSLKHMNFNQNSVHWGEDNNNWKGGRRVTKDGYISILLRKSDFFLPMANKNKYVLEHRLVMAKSLGRLLEGFELVHHIDGNRSNNVLPNLQLTTAGKHNLSYRDGYIAGFNAGILDGQGKKRVRVEV